MNKLLRHLLLLACWLGANGAFAGLYVGRDDKPKTATKALSPLTEAPPVGVAKTASHPIAKTVAGVSSVNVATSSVKKLQNVQLSNALDQAVAQMGDAMALVDYSIFPTERVEALVSPQTDADRNEAQTLFDEVAKGNRYIKAINRGAILALPQSTGRRFSEAFLRPIII